MFHLVFNADENYIKYLAVLITSIIKKTDTSKNFKELCQQKPFSGSETCKAHCHINCDDLIVEGYCFHILTNKLSENTRSKLQILQDALCTAYPCEIIIHTLDEKIFSDFPKTGAAHSSYLPYFRLKLTSVLDKEVDKCLYLDSDMLVNCDLRELFCIDLKDYCLAAVNDPGTKKRKILFQKEKKIQSHSFDTNYFNSGFLLINLKEYKKAKIEEKCAQLAKNCFYITAADQDLLNATIESEKIFKLPFTYNFIVITMAFAITLDEDKNRLQYTRKEFTKAFQNPKIYHYGEKPWKYLQSFTDYKGCNINDFWWEMAALTPVFNEELLQEKKQIKEYLQIAAYGFEALNLYRKWNFFGFKNVIKNDLEDLSQTSKI
ncbi:glycosyltransferase family 8 protein, partial [Campylobacter sp. MIT 21-1685]|uniref:glycosyltransferase family 8 protein n=1 Tax=unclassified Campylobacter TaxID=2593542 RepID=UPI00224A672E